MSAGLLSHLQQGICLNLSHHESVLTALGEQWGFTGTKAGATRGARGSGASAGPKAAAVIPGW